MEFRTVVKIDPAPFSISHKDRIIMCGSCFVENIGNKLMENKFPVSVNPFGILYNPSSIASSLRYLAEGKVFNKEELFFHEGLFHSFSHHSRFSAATEEECLQHINGTVKDIHISETDYLILTFGTSYVYELKSSSQVVSNCHKLPEKLFNRRRLEVEEIVRTYQELIEALLRLNPELKIILSVSPIRHWKDGAHENQLSKSILLLSVDKLRKYFSQVFYFPSYEIVLDELRDYRFYTHDMNHIAAPAIDYIWERFQETFFNKETKSVLQKWQKVKQALQHKPFQPHSPQYKAFIDKHTEYLLSLKKEYPYLPVEKELEELKNKAG
ncbi:MAG: GSCFA domain-containing protein [Candidatus Azobacteroides sp.]|nr:GSCFA domain-containing protein [Candidatus Azobacteroides sp.]